MPHLPGFDIPASQPIDPGVRMGVPPGMGGQIERQLAMLDRSMSTLANIPEDDVFAARGSDGETNRIPITVTRKMRTTRIA